MGVANSRDHHLYHPSQSPIKVVLKRRNEPLKKERLKWKNEHPMTEGQLRCKRAEFWDTAPAFDGRKEIWDALRAAAVAVELNDLEMAQAIVDGACITLPHENDLSTNAVVADIVRNVVATGATVTLSPQGKSCQVLLNKKLRSCPGTLTESYDELGNRYQLPAYTLTPPANLITERTNDSEAPEKKEPKKPPAFLKEEFQLRVRLSCGKDLRISASMSDTISQLKTVLEGQEDIEVAHQRWFFAGKLLTDKIRLQDTKIQKDFVVQVIVNNYLPVTKLMPN